MKALVIGAAGFVGGYLIDALIEENYLVSATKLQHEVMEDSRVYLIDLDLLDSKALEEALSAIQPDVIFHLAAQSSVAVSWANPTLTAEINILGTINLLEALRKNCIQSRLILIGSSEEYGFTEKTVMPVCEETSLDPQNPYGITKLTQELYGKLYANAYHLNVVLTRSFNHFGPKQREGFVVSDFCRQVALIEAGRQEPRILVGNLSARRDFTDVRDVVRAYCLLARNGRPGQIYNVGSGTARLINDLLSEIISCSRLTITVEKDQSKFRPVDIPEIYADISKIKKDTGWKPIYSLKETIRDTLDYWRMEINHIST